MRFCGKERDLFKVAMAEAGIETLRITKYNLEGA